MQQLQRRLKSRNLNRLRIKRTKINKANNTSFKLKQQAIKES